MLTPFVIATHPPYWWKLARLPHISWDCLEAISLILALLNLHRVVLQLLSRGGCTQQSCVTTIYQAGLPLCAPLNGCHGGALPFEMTENWSAVWHLVTFWLNSSNWQQLISVERQLMADQLNQSVSQRELGGCLCFSLLMVTLWPRSLWQLMPRITKTDHLWLQPIPSAHSNYQQ